jgi:stress-induced morphogen
MSVTIRCNRYCQNYKNSNILVLLKQNHQKFHTLTLTQTALPLSHSLHPFHQASYTSHQSNCITTMSAASQAQASSSSTSNAADTDVECNTTESKIIDILSRELHPIYIEVINESSTHNVPKGSQTHFKVIVVSKSFNCVQLIQRHRLVNKLLSPLLPPAGRIHALSIVAKTPEQWQEMIASGKAAEVSPACLGGMKHEQRRNEQQQQQQAETT